MNIKITIIDCNDFRPDNMPAYHKNISVICEDESYILDICHSMATLAIDNTIYKDKHIIYQYLKDIKLPITCMYSVFTNQDTYKDVNYLTVQVLLNTMSRNYLCNMLLYKDNTSDDINFLCTTDTEFMKIFVRDNLKNKSIIPYKLSIDGEWVDNEQIDNI